MGFKLLKKRLGIQDVSLKSEPMRMQMNLFMERQSFHLFMERQRQGLLVIFLFIFIFQVGDFMTQFDSDCDGKMSFVEFQKAVEKLKELEAAVS